MLDRNGSQYDIDETQTSGVSGRTAALVLMATMVVIVILYLLINWQG